MEKDETNVFKLVFVKPYATVLPIFLILKMEMSYLERVHSLLGSLCQGGMEGWAEAALPPCSEGRGRLLLRQHQVSRGSALRDGKVLLEPGTGEVPE